MSYSSGFVACKDEPDSWATCRNLARHCDQPAEQLASFNARYGEEVRPEPKHLLTERFGGTRQGGLGLLRDLDGLYW
jgi:hypothetical protein